MKHPFHAFAALWLSSLVVAPLPVFAGGGKETPPALSAVLNRPLTLAEVIDVAARQNAVILAARKEVEARYGVAVQVHSIVLPKVLAEASYSARQDSMIEANQNRALPSYPLSIPSLGIDTILGGGSAALVNNQAWSADVRIVQSIYEGGQIVSALRQEQLIREQALIDFDTTVADVLLNARIAYDDVQLAAQQIALRTLAVESLTTIRDQIKIKRDAGDVSEFEMLRAEVELANAKTPLATAKQDFVIAKQLLLLLMGFDVPERMINDIPLILSTPLRAPKYSGDLPAALNTAAAQRTELDSIRLSAQLGDEAIVTAKSGAKPSVQAFAGYEAVSRVHSRSIDDGYGGAIAGVQVSWAIFDGFRTRGRIAEAVARREQIGFKTDALQRQISLEVRTAWERMRQARVILDSQAGNVVSGVKALELSQARYDAGAGTQIEVLNTVEALTSARDFYASSLRNYSVAYSQLLRATGEDTRRRRGGKEPVVRSGTVASPSPSKSQKSKRRNP